MAYYAALVSLVQLLKEINHPEHPYPNSPLHDSLCEKLSRLLQLLENYSTKDHKEETADFLERRIRDASYQAQDIIETQISNQTSEALRLDIDVREKEYCEDLEKVKFEFDSIAEELKRINGESHTTHEDKHLTKIKAQLCGESSRLEVVSIFGTGGTGKTTLVRNIFDSKVMVEYFACRAWVSVSQDYHLRKVLLGIGNSMGIIDEKLSREGEEVLKLHIYKHLFGRRYLIIMDDMWDAKIWDDVKRIFPDDHNGSRVMITTRQSDVASYASSSNFINEIPYLNEYESWNLFCKRVLCPPELEDIGKLIAKNCRGLPLAIVVVAGLLSKVNKTRHHWEEIARDLRFAAMKNDDHLSNILSLSYNHLPHHLKPCFLYFGGFPEDDEIPATKLIKLWVAEGFLNPVQHKDLEELGERCLEDLVSRNLVLVTKMRSNGKFKYCSIHDILREFCVRKARYENFLVLQESDTIGNVRRVYIPPGSYIPDREEEYIPHVFSTSHVRSILFSGYSWDNIESYVSEFKLLRVLDALALELDLFPDEIVKLLHLRFLAFQCFECNIPPSIFKLQNLQTLIIQGKASLPSEIWEMPQLRHVMSSTMTLPPIPNGARFIPGMLQTLCTVVDFTFTNDIILRILNLKKLRVMISAYEPYENRIKFDLNNLAHLHKLETLDINFDVVSSNLDNVISSPESFAFPYSLKKLTLKGCMLPWHYLTMCVGSLPFLQVLKLRQNSFVGKVWELVEGQFLNLKFLLMERLDDLEYWIAESTHFPSLEHLVLQDLRKLKEIPCDIGEIPTLQSIQLKYCNDPVIISAKQILEEQEELGNEGLQIRVS